MQDQFDGVALYVATARAGSFARAAKALGLTRSAVGKGVARLEARLGVRLFHRTTRVQSLTEDGQLYFERCLRILEDLQATETQLGASRHQVAGRLRVSAPALFGQRCVAPILLEFAREHPQLELLLSLSDKHVDLFADGFDLALRNGELGSGHGLLTRRLATQRKLICASPAYLATRGRPGRIEDLVGHDILLYQRADFVHLWRLADDSGQFHDVPLPSRLRFDDLEVIANAAAAGLGLAWLPDWVVRDRLRKGELTAVLTDRPCASMECHALWAEGPHTPLRLRLALDRLIEKLPSYTDIRLNPSDHRS